MKIKDVEAAIGVDRANIRYYEKEGLLTTRRNPVNGYREYSEENVETLRKIIFLRGLGVGIEDIHLLQTGKIPLQDIMKKRLAEIENEEDKFGYQRQTCGVLLKEAGDSFADIPTEAYQTEETAGQEELFADAIHAFSAMREVGIVWLMIAFSAVLSLVAVFFLEGRIAVQFEGSFVLARAGKWILLLFPVVEILAAIFVKTMVLNTIYRNFPLLLNDADLITGYASIWFMVLACSYQVMIILYGAGYQLNVEMVCEVINVIFILAGIFLYFRSRRKYRVS